MRGVLTLLQMALATAILVAAGLLVRSFDRLQQVNLGFDHSRVLTLNVEPQVQTQAQYRQQYDEMIQRVSALPGVEAVGASYVAPFARGRFGLDTGYLLRPTHRPSRRMEEQYDAELSFGHARLFGSDANPAPRGPLLHERR